VTNDLGRRIVTSMQKLTRKLIEPITTPIANDIARVHLPAQYANPLLAYSRRYFSQNDEDGILLEILRRIKLTKPSTFLEFGVERGIECNTIILLALCWRGAWVGGEPLAFELPKNARLAFSQRWITKDNAVDCALTSLAAVGDKLENVRVASIDIDGNDASVVRELLIAGLSPEVFIVEYNAKFPPPVEFEIPYDDKHLWRGDDYQGASLQTWAAILSDYQLIACNDNGVNAFFIKRVYAEQFSDVATDISTLFRMGHYHIYPRSGHPTSPQIVLHLATRPNCPR
jgi:hypothetical protein